jgi:hypothetical protein
MGYQKQGAQQKIQMTNNIHWRKYIVTTNHKTMHPDVGI